MISGFKKVIDGKTCASTATVYSLVADENAAQATNSWFETSLKETFGLWVNLASATGTGNVNVYLDISPLTPREHNMAYDATTTQYYKTFTLGSVIADNTIQIFTDEDLDTLSFRMYPFRSARVRVVGTADNPADTVVTAYWVQAATAV